MHLHGFHPPAEGEGSAVFVVFEDTRPHMMFKKKNVFSARYSPIGLQMFFENVSQDPAFAEFCHRGLQAHGSVRCVLLFRGGLMQAHFGNL